MTSRGPGYTTVTKSPAGRMEVVDWGLDRGCTRVSKQFGRGWRIGERVLVCDRPFTVLDMDWFSEDWVLVAQDSAWWAVWMAWRPARDGFERWMIRPWIRWLWRTGRMEPAMEGRAKTVEDLWVRTWWPAGWSRETRRPA